MIDVTRFNGKSFVLNAELIEVMEENLIWKNGMMVK